MKTDALPRWLLLPAAGFVLIGMAQGSPSPAPIGHKVQVSDAAGTRAVVALGGRLIADYGGFKLYNVPSTNANLPDSAEIRDSYNSIFLNAVQLDTSRAEVQALRKPAGAFEGKQMHLVHFAGPVEPVWRQELLDAGVQIVDYIPQNAYLVYGDSASIARVQALAAGAPHIQWEGAYLDDYKIHPRAVALDKKGNPRQVFTIQLMADAAANAETLKLIDQLKLAPVEKQGSILHYVNVVVRMSAADLGKIAARPDVVSIQPYSAPKKVCERQDQIVAGNLSGNVPSGPGYLAWLEGKGFTQAQFTASGFVVDVSDSGIDNGTTSPNHFGLYIGGEINSPSRVAYNILEGTPNQPSTLAGCDGHGNLNTHIISGYDDSPGFPFEDSSGYHYGLGVCPFVKVGSSVIFDPDNSTDPDDATVISTAYEHGARISNNSWGDSDPSDDGSYSSDSQAYDALVRDAEPGIAGNQEMSIVFAAGNDGPTNNSVSPPGTAKNVITVGGGQNVQAFGGCDSSDVCDDGADNANSIIDFSSVGPCDDGRRKPDIVAPSTHVSGGVPQESLTGPVGDGNALNCFLEDGDGVSGGVGTNGGVNLFFPNNQEFYTASSGTSHSTPAVSGGCALVRQYFINSSLPPPSPAMTKAFLMNSARYMTGSGADDTLWSESQGMGEMDLGTAFDGTPRTYYDEVATNLFTASGQTRVFSGTVGDSAKPFRVTVAWTDAPGSTTGHSYNNDLDLTVSVGGNTYKGNVFSGANSTAGGSADKVDNVESVFLPAGVSGSFTVTILATSINSIGVPNSSNALSQDFALVVYNTGAAAIVVAAGSSLTTNEPCTNGVVNAGETVAVNLALKNTGSAATSNLVATLLMTNGVVLPSAAQSYGALAIGSTATRTFSFLADGTCGHTMTALLQLQDGANDLGIVSYGFQLGLPLSVTNFSQNFDSVGAGNLPAGWSNALSASDLTGWTTEATNYDSALNAVWCPDSSNPGAVYLYSPSIAVSDGSNQLSFRNEFNLESTYDGGALEISIGGGAFADILTAGGSFVSNGYTGTITDEDDSSGQKSPLINRQAWTGNSEGFLTTIVGLPAAASGTNVQFRWICGTDGGNGNLVGAGGWWIDTISVFQSGFDCSSCPAPGVTVPTIIFPTNGSQFAAFSPTLEVVGLAPVDSTTTITNNSVSNVTVSADGNGVYVANATLEFGTNILTATVAGTNSSSNVVVVITLAAPILVAPTYSSTNVTLSGMGAPGATVYVYAGAVATGTPLTSFVIGESGSFSASVVLALGNSTLTATEQLGSETSPAETPVSVSVVAEPAPIIVSPTNGTALSKVAVTVSGKGTAGAAVTIYDVMGGVTNTLATATVNRSGNFSANGTLVAGANTLFAIEGVDSPASAPVEVNVYLGPAILVEPMNQTNFLKGTATFSAVAVGAAPLHLFWEANGVRIRGADSATYTLTDLKTSDTFNSFTLIASNKYSVAVSSPVTVTLVPNPFTNLAGAYYGLFAETNAQFESSGLLSLNLTSQGKFTAKMLNAGGSYSFSGALSGVGWASNTVSRGAALVPLTVVMDLDTSNGTDQILGTVSAGTNWTAALEANHTGYSAATNPFPGLYVFTLIFGNTNTGAQSPGGDGYGTVKVTAAGLASFSGVLPDDTSVATAAAGISQDGRWPLYIPLYGKFGSLEGWVNFNTTNFASFSGTNAMWFRTNADGKLYRSGFTNALTIAGSTSLPDNIPALSSLTNLQVILSGGNLPDALSTGVTVAGNGKFSVNGTGIPGLTLTLSPSYTGVIKGSFTDPATGVAAPIKGVAFPGDDSADGFFLSGTNSGNFLLTPQ